METPASPPFQVLYVSDIDHVSREEHLWQAFSPWAHGIRSIKLIRDIQKPFALTHAYVNFTNHKDASDALANIQPLFINSSYCRVVPYDGVTFMRPSRFDQNGGSGVFVKNLDMQVTAAVLWGFFMGFGTIVGCRIAIDEMGVPRGFAYITYENAEQAAAAIEAMDGQTIGRRRIFASRNLPKSQRATRLFLKFDVSTGNEVVEEPAITAKLEQFGSLESVSVPRDHQGHPKGFAFATYREQADAHRVINEVKEIAGVAVNVELATGGSAQRFSSPHISPANSLGRIGANPDDALAAVTNAAQAVSKERAANAASAAAAAYNAAANASSSAPSAAANATSETNSDIAQPQSSTSPSSTNADGQGESKSDPHAQPNPISNGKPIPVDYSVGNKYQAAHHHHALAGKGSPNNTNLFVRPLSSEVRESDLQQEFGKFGTISSAKVMIDHEGKSREFGFVSFETLESAKKAVEALNGSEKWGNVLFVAPALSRRKSHNHHPHSRLNMHPHPHGHGHGPRGIASPIMGPYPGVYYIPMEYPYEYNPYSAVGPTSPYSGTAVGHQGSIIPTAMPMPMFQGAAGAANSLGMLSTSHLESASVEELGEIIHPSVLRHSAIGGNLELASRVTGLLLQQPRRDIISWLESPGLLDLRIQQGFDAYQEWSKQTQNGQS